MTFDKISVLSSCTLVSNDFNTTGDIYKIYKDEVFQEWVYEWLNISSDIWETPLWSCWTALGTFMLFIS